MIRSRSYPFVGGMFDSRRAPVSLMPDGSPPAQVMVSFLRDVHHGYEFDSGLGAYVLVASAA